ncbi:hypothetical protein Tco_1239794 [Tanacetum coccineum]
MFIKYSTGQIPPKKSRGKGSKGKKIIDDSHETVDVSEEFEPEPEPARKKTSSKKRVKKEVTLSTDDNIISNDPDATLALAKSISKTEAEEAEAARKVHATHARIVIEHVPKSARRVKSEKVTSDPPKKGKSAPSLTLEEQEATNIMQALKESRKTSIRQPGTEGSNEGTDEETNITEENVILEWGDEQDSEYFDDDNDAVEKDDKYGDADDEGNDHISDTQDADDEDVKTESDEDDIYKYKIRVRKDEDEEMLNAKVDDSDKGDEEVSDAAKADAEKTLEVKDDAKKTELPPSSSNLSVSSGFGDQFLKLYFDSSLVSTVKDTTDSEINSLLEVKIQSEVPHTQSPSMLTIVTTLPPPSVSTTPSIPQQTTTPIPTPTITTDALIITTAISDSDALFVVQLRVAKLEKDVSNIKKIDLSVEALDALKTQVPSVVDNYIGSKVGDTPKVDLKQGSEKSASEILKIKREQDEKQQKLKFTIKSTDKAALEEYDLKSALYQSMHVNKYFNRNRVNHQLYHALMEALIEDENAMDKGVVDIVKDHEKKHDDDEDDDDEDPPAGPSQGKKTKRRRTKESESSKKPSTTKETPKGKASSKGSKTGKFAPTKEPVKEPIAKVVMDDAGNDVARDDNQPQDASKPKTTKTLNPDWFKQPPRPPTPDPEWNKRQVVLN